MLAEHIEAQILHGLDIVDERFVRGGGVHTVRPIALIQQTVLEVGLVVEEHTHHTLAVGAKTVFAHTKVATHAVRANRQP